MPGKPIPEGYHTLNAHLAVDDTAQAIEFYKRAFGAKERGRMHGPDGKIAHAEIEIGDSVVMLNDPVPQSPYKPPKELGGTSGGLFVYVEDVDELAKQFVDAGGTITAPIEDMFWGDRFGSVTDPFGHTWSIATRVEDIPPEEMEERAKAAMAGMSMS
jgi:PhnB protein